ncbi:DUF4180 domain-containing protein [Alkaliphilus oremlandii]|uniref:DUF4180 domain-containing protein n=1 Tax=Alkaliphilus oremlandii (strain OhILAs) TaxID=350688 RepID=A8MKD4_ALKOO|nr:DUF4180 domain-containing protein [Alkaliphilus oremlandii]ABW20266.1 conserved hypothetical protein [Alkaliphilus oremlandii OhILAs]
MEINKITENNMDIAVVSSDEILITDVQSALDFIATVQYQSDCNRILLQKSSLCEDFFNLRTGVAGEILQKFVNYDVKLAIVGDFSVYSSKSLRDFIYESNHGKDLFFLGNDKEAIQKLSFA